MTTNIMHHIANLFAVLCALCATAQSPIVVDNLAAVPQSEWTYCAMPAKHVPPTPGWLVDTKTEQRHAYWPDREGIHVRLERVDPGTHKLVFDRESDEPKIEWAWHPQIDLAKLQPRLWLDGRLSDWPAYWARGAQRPGASYVTVTDLDDCRQKWHVHEVMPNPGLTLDLWATVYTGQLAVEFVAQVSYGYVTDAGKAPEIELSALYEIDSAPKVHDFAAHAGLPLPNGVNQDGTIPMLLVTPGTRLHRGRRIQVWGCWNPQAGREVAPLCAVYTGWDGNWFWQGTVPRIPSESIAEETEALSLFRNPPRTDYWGRPMTYWSARPYAQPPKSDTTGEQYGFGNSDLGQIAAGMQAWRIHAMKWSADSYALRPTAFREPNGDPMQAAHHPNAETYDGGYDARFGTDRLGYPEPGEVWDVRTMTDNDYGKSDAQHRQSRMLHGLARLTGSPALYSIVRDQLEIAKMDRRLKIGWGDAARAMGRVLQEDTGALWLGFQEARRLIDQRMEIAAREVASHRDDEVFLLGPVDTAKYGWRWSTNGQPIYGYQYWQQAIAAVQGMDQVWLATGDPRAREWSLRASRQAVRYGFHDGGTWIHVYAVNWNNGKQLTDAQWQGALWGQPNDYAVVTGDASTWTVCACELVAAEEPDTALGNRAKAILRQFGTPKRWLDSNWRCVR